MTQTEHSEPIVLDDRAWPRHGHDPERVAAFMDLYQDGGVTALPPIEIVRAPDGTRIVSDGRTRCEAARRLGLSSLPVTYIEAPADVDPVEFAYRRALEHSSTSSKPLSRAERKSAALRLLSAEESLSHREIARLTGLSHQTIGRLANASGPVDQSGSPGDAYVAQTSAAELTKRLVTGVARVWDARGLGDLVTSRMPRTLAAALIDRYDDEEALRWARRIESWGAAAVAQLEDR